MNNPAFIDDFYLRVLVNKQLIEGRYLNRLHKLAGISNVIYDPDSIFAVDRSKIIPVLAEARRRHCIRLLAETRKVS